MILGQNRGYTAGGLVAAKKTIVLVNKCNQCVCLAFLQVCEGLLCAAAGSRLPLQQLLSQLQPASGNGPCTAVWTAGAIAYRSG
jgi:hypothetical protein